jgi:hypothetical protein
MTRCSLMPRFTRLEAQKSRSARIGSVESREFRRPRPQRGCRNSHGFDGFELLGVALLGGLVSGVNGCGPPKDVVFDAIVAELDASPVRVRENAGTVSVPVRLAHALDQAVSASYQLRGVEAQDSCPEPDFIAAQATVTWEAGAPETTLDLSLNDDDYAETDETLELVLAPLSGVFGFSPAEIPVVIEDDDRTGLIQAELYGVTPGLASDQSAAIQRALDAGAAAGRGVVVFPPGDYEVVSAELAPGTTLSARGASWHRPPGAGAATVTLRVRHTGTTNSLPTLIEGLRVDGRRELQGAYRNLEQQNAHLIALSSAVDQPGRLQALVDDVNVSFGTGDGVAVGPNSDVQVCRLRGTDLWREFVSLHGGGSRLTLRDLEASASAGTSGMWLDGFILGYQNTRRVTVDMQDVKLGTGDIEIEIVDGSSLTVERLEMVSPPLRIWAPDSTVRISDSVLALGVPSERHNHFDVPHDLEVTGSTLVAHELIDETAGASEADRSFAAVSIHWQADLDVAPVPGPHRVLFQGCRFEVASNVESNDTVYAIQEPTAEGTVFVRGCTLGPGLAGWFFPGGCADCRLEP